MSKNSYPKHIIEIALRYAGIYGVHPVFGDSEFYDRTAMADQALKEYTGVCFKCKSRTNKLYYIRYERWWCMGPECLK